jgi:hypothetical protein
MELDPEHAIAATSDTADTVVAAECVISRKPETSNRPPRPHPAGPFGQLSRVNATTRNPIPAIPVSTAARRDSVRSNVAVARSASAAAQIATMPSHP